MYTKYMVLSLCLYVSALLKCNEIFFWVDDLGQWGCVGSNCTSLWDEKPNPKKEQSTHTPATSSIKIYTFYYIVDTECQNITRRVNIV